MPSKRPIEAVEAEESEPMIECDVLGPPVHHDNTLQRTYYQACKTDDLMFSVGDCVRVRLGEEGQDTEEFAYAQILAIYEEQDEVVAEARWFMLQQDLPKKVQKSFKCAPNELVESDQLDDIPAGAVLEHIEIIDSTSAPTNTSSSAAFVCNYLYQHSARSLAKASSKFLLQRGLEYSHYGEYYRATTSSNPTDPQQQDPVTFAISRLHVNVLPDFLCGREAEGQAIYQFLRSSIQAGYAHSILYVYGFPGTGKTASVKWAVHKLRGEITTSWRAASATSAAVAAQGLPEFRFLEINCLRLKNPKDAYTVLWRGISGEHCSPSTALKRLQHHFSPSTLPASSASHAQPAAPLVLLVDELDYLLSKDLQVLYHLFEWPLGRERGGGGLIVVSIANTMNLPESLQSRVSSRLRASLMKLVFAPYTFEQLKKIIQERLKDVNADISKGINATATSSSSSSSVAIMPDQAIELLGRKAANMGGDVRRALQMTREVLEKFRERKRSETATSAATSTSLFFQLIKEVGEELKRHPLVRYLALCPALHQVVVLALGRERKRCGGGGEGEGVGVGGERPMTPYEVYDTVRDFLKQIRDKEEEKRNKSRNLIVSAPDQEGKAIEEGPADVPAEEDVLPVLPPLFLFLRCLDGLKEAGLLVASRGFAERLVLTASLNYPDICAALEDTFLMPYTGTM